MKLIKHHITPQCLLKHKDKSFVDRVNNIAHLTYEQHVKAHKWLAMLTNDSILFSVWVKMSNGKWTFDNNGRKVSNKTRNKLSDSRRGKKASLTTRLKMSNSKLGKSAWNKGKTGIFSKETLEINRISHLKENISPEKIKKMSDKAKINKNRSKPCFINNIYYCSAVEASKIFKVSKQTICNWIKDDKRSDCFYK